MSRIIGIGVDLLALHRIKALIDRRGIEPFARRILSPRERADLLETSDKIGYLQSRFAVKEALFKAASSYRRLGWSEVTIAKMKDGRPIVVFEEDPSLSAMISISHDQGFLVATALVQKTD